jgi:hypothetical protein
MHTGLSSRSASQTPVVKAAATSQIPSKASETKQDTSKSSPVVTAFHTIAIADEIDPDSSGEPALLADEDTCSSFAPSTLSVPQPHSPQSTQPGSSGNTADVGHSGVPRGQSQVGASSYTTADNVIIFQTALERDIFTRECVKGTKVDVLYQELLVQCMSTPTFAPWITSKPVKERPNTKSF